MSSMDYFGAGFNRALARRSREQAKQHEQQKIQKITGDVSNTVTTTKTIITNTNTITKLSDEQYKKTIVQTMIALIHKRKMK